MTSSASASQEDPNERAGGAPAPVVLTPNSRFMQNYRIASAANAGSDCISIANGSGDAELFTVGSDGQIWNYYPDSTSETGYSLANTGLTGSSIAAGLDINNRIVVFSSLGTTIAYVIEINQGGQRWSDVGYCTVPLPSGVIGIAQIFPLQVPGHLLVGVLTAAQSVSPGITYSFSYVDWSASVMPPTAFNATTFTIISKQCVWTGSSFSNATFALMDNTIVGYQIATGSNVYPPVAGTFKTIDVSASLDKTGNTQVLSILSDGNAYHLVGGDGQAYSWQQLTIGRQFKEIRTVTDMTGLVHGFALSVNNDLWHLPPSASSATGYLDPGKIGAKTVQIAVALDDGGAINLFAVGAAQNDVSYMMLQQLSGNWQSTQLMVQTGNTPEPYSSYTSDLTFVDAVGAPLVNVGVTLWSSGSAQLTINGSVYGVDPKNPARVATNDVGVISVSQQTGSLTVPQILVSVPSLMPAGTYIVVDQVANIQARLATDTGTDLMNATNTAGQPILTGTYRTQESADAVMSAVNDCMKIGQAPLARPASSAYVKPGERGRGAFHYIGPIERIGLIDPTAVNVGFKFSVVDGNAVYKALGPAEADAERAFMATLPNSAGFLDWIGSIGDLIEGVAEGVVDIVSTVVTTVGNAIQATINFFVDGISYVFNAIIDTIAKAIDVAQSVFAAVKIFFEDLYEWLGYIFNWGDILRTHTALAYTINQMLTFCSGAVGGIQSQLDAAIAGLRAQLQTLFQNAINNIAGSQSLGTYQEDNQGSSPAFEAANSNNLIYNNLVDNGSNSSLSGGFSLVRSGDGGPIDAFIAQFETFLQTAQASPAFAQALTYFTNLGGSPDQIFRQLLAGLMSIAEGILDTILAGVQAVIDALLQLFQSLIQIFQASLNSEWDIPFVTDFYNWITDGSPLSALDLICLIVAIPTTVLYKVVFGAAPFPDDASLTAFEASFNAATMLTASGLGSSNALDHSPAPGSNGWTGLLPKTGALLLATGSAVAEFFAGALSGICDIVPPPGNPPSVIANAVFVLEIGITAAGFPWFIEAGPVSCSDAAGRSRVNWIYEVAGVLLDCVFHFREGTPSDVEAGATVVYGIGHMASGISASVGQSSALAITNNILGPIPEICKALRLTTVVTATEGISLPVLAAVDGLFGLALAVTNFVEEMNEIQGDQQHPVMTISLRAIPGY